MHTRAQFRIPAVLVIHTQETDGYFQVCMNRDCLKRAKLANQGRTAKHRRAARHQKAEAKKRLKTRVANAQKRENYNKKDLQHDADEPSETTIVLREKKTESIIEDTVRQNIQAVEEIPLLRIIKFKWVYFKTDEWDLNDSGKVELSVLVTYLQNHPTLLLEIRSHTDDEGTDHYNMNLSNKRAISVNDYLVKSGLSKLRITWKAYGAARPVMPNTSESNKALNRRVEYTLYRIGQG